ncbi:MAG TPA: anti-sigma factor, partial [Candidatus Cryosericum sp.]|nr:anti-sigma factor [Candidatus Cryosericum sp.]
AIGAHLASGCPRCAGGLAEAEAVLGHLPFVLAPERPPASVREELLRRVAASPRRRQAAGLEPGASTERPLAAPWRAGLWRPALAAIAAALLTALGLSASFERSRQALRVRLDAQDREIARLHETVQSAGETLRVLRSPAVRVVALSGTKEQPQAAGRIFWDQSRRTWHFYAAALRSPGAGRTYQLWFITPAQEKISAGTFDVDASGEGSLEVPLPPGLDVVALAAVSDEPAGGSPQPTGSIHLAGAVPGPSS